MRELRIQRHTEIADVLFLKHDKIEAADAKAKSTGSLAR